MYRPRSSNTFELPVIGCAANGERQHLARWNHADPEGDLHSRCPGVTCPVLWQQRLIKRERKNAPVLQEVGGSNAWCDANRQDIIYRACSIKESSVQHMQTWNIMLIPPETLRYGTLKLGIGVNAGHKCHAHNLRSTRSFSAEPFWLPSVPYQTTRDSNKVSPGLRWKWGLGDGGVTAVLFGRSFPTRHPLLLENRRDGKNERSSE